MFNIGRLIGLDLPEKQDRLIASEYARKLGQYLENKEYSVKDIVDAINYALYKIQKQDPQYADCILKELIRLYPKIHEKYNFKAVDKI